MAVRWTPDEDRTLRVLYDARRPVTDIAAALGRTPDAVTARRRQIGIPRRDRSWTAREDALLRAAAASGVPATWVARRLSRTPDAVRWRQRVLSGRRPGRPRYEPAEDAAIRRCFAEHGDISALARRLGRSPDAVRLRAQALGVHQPARRTRWTPAEDAIVRDGYAMGHTCAAIARALADRTPTSVAARARRLGLADHGRRWSPADDALLRRHALARTPLTTVARTLVRTPQAVRRRCRHLGLDPPSGPGAARAGKRWTEQEDALLRLHAGVNPATLAEWLGRSDHAVTERLRRLGLRDGRKRSPHRRSARAGAVTPAQRASIRRTRDPLTPTRIAALARRLDMPPAAIRRLAADPPSAADGNGTGRHGPAAGLVGDRATGRA